MTDSLAGATPSARPGRAKRGEGELLREEIVEAAIDLLASTGTAERITIRNIAEQVGVTSPSIYLHFASKNDVIFAACERLWQDFGQILAEARAGLDDPVERMRACGTAYLQFALDRPALYRVLFMSEPVDQPEDFDVQALLENVGFLQLFDDVRELNEMGRLRVGDPLDVSLLLWSSVHGVASLILDHPKIPWPQPVRSLDLLFEALAEGLVHTCCPPEGEGPRCEAVGRGLPNSLRCAQSSRTSGRTCIRPGQVPHSASVGITEVGRYRMDVRTRARSGRLVGVAVLVLTITTSGALMTSLPAAGQLPPGGTFTDDDGNTHEGMIEAIAAEGITLGCNEEGTLFCPGDPVRRDQMASFIARGFELPATTQDFFPDDEGNTHEDNINRLAAAGITEGLEDGTYDPAGVVTRAQMGSFLARAMELDPVGGDRFDDVSGVHEANINAIAAAGVTEGCNEAGNLYCPSDPVRRDQMASFIGRALGLEPIDPPPGTTTTTIDGTTTTTTQPVGL